MRVRNVTVSFLAAATMLMAETAQDQAATAAAKKRTAKRLAREGSKGQKQPAKPKSSGRPS